MADGGASIDTLAFTGSDLKINLTDIRGRIDDVEIIDLTGRGNNQLSVNLLDLLDLLDLLNLSDSSNTLRIDGNTGDSISGLGIGWIDNGISENYHVYMQDAFTLLVGIDVTTDFMQ